MQNVKTKLWSGAILIQQDSLPGLSQGDEISVDIFHEEASKQNRVNFDWASSNTALSSQFSNGFVLFVRYKEDCQVLEVSQRVSEEQET